MKSKIQINFKIITVFVVMIFIPNNTFTAYDLYNSEYEYFPEGSSICANKEYIIDTDDILQIQVLTEDNYQEDSFQYNPTQSLMFPENAGNIKLKIEQFNNETLQYENPKYLTFTVEPCEYEPVVDDYEKKELLTLETLTDNMIKFSNSQIENVSNYNLYIQLPGSPHAKKIKFNELGEATFEISQNSNTSVIQVNENYVTSDGSQVNNFFEIIIDSDGEYVIKPVDSFEVSVIDAKDVINIRDLFNIAISFFIFVIISIILSIVKRRSKKKTANVDNNKKKRSKKKKQSKKVKKVKEPKVKYFKIEKSEDDDD